MARLFVIEASGKARTFAAILKDLGEDAVVQFTLGHLFELPSFKGPIGIDRAYRDFDRKPVKLDICERLRREAQLATEVIVATDADLEGDVIAWDVATLVRDMHPNPKRMRLKGMDKQSVRDALGELGPVLKSAAVPGRTRAIVDRLIGVGFTKDNVAVGRVSTALLGLVNSTKPGTQRLRLVAPAKDRGRPFTAECNVEGILTNHFARRLEALDFPALDLKSRAPWKGQPGHTGDIMVRCAETLDISPNDVAKRMQRNYEAGTLSYPRAGSRAFSPMVANKMAEILRKAGYPSVQAGNFEPKPETDVHDAPYPIGKVDLVNDPRQLDEDAAVRSVIARDLVKAGQNRTREMGLAATIGPFLLSKGIPPNVATMIATLDWLRDVGPRAPGQESYPVSEIVERRADVVLLERSVALGLGRPSTWGNHIEKFMSRGLVDENLALTSKGEHWVKGSPAALLDPRVSVAIEQACERVPARLMDDPDREPWELNAERITNALPPSIKDTMTALIAHEAPRAKIDPIVAYGFDRDFKAEAEALSRPGYAPAAD